MNLTSATHADVKAFAVSAVFALRASGDCDGAVSLLAARELDCVIGVAQEECLQQQHNSPLIHQLHTHTHTHTLPVYLAIPVLPTERYIVHCHIIKTDKQIN